jgi:FixJ family two-component response regulator
MAKKDAIGGSVYIVGSDPADHPAFANLASTPQIKVSVLPCLDDFLAAFRNQGPACLVIDAEFAPGGVEDLRRTLAESGIILPIVYIIDRADLSSAVAAFKGGAVDLLEKPITVKPFRVCVEHALRRDRERRAEGAQAQMAVGRLARLTSRERDILKLVVGGMSSREIGLTLGISTKTVEAHRGRIAAKASARNLAELVRLAVAAGIVAEPTGGME